MQGSNLTAALLATTFTIPALAQQAKPKAIFQKLSIEQVLGKYRRSPIVSNWDKGVIEWTSDADGNRALRWLNDAQVAWPLKPDLANGALWTGPENPYYDNNRVFRIILRTDDHGRDLPEVAGFRFNGGFYAKVDGQPSQPSAATSDPVSGTLRTLTETELHLQTADSVVTFRLLPGTAFQDAAGKPIRDSLLRPGDHLSVQRSAEAPGTATVVSLEKSDNPQGAGNKPGKNETMSAAFAKGTHVKMCRTVKIFSGPSKGNSAEGSGKVLAYAETGDDVTILQSNPGVSQIEIAIPEELRSRYQGRATMTGWVSTSAFCAN